MRRGTFGACAIVIAATLMTDRGALAGDYLTYRGGIPIGLPLGRVIGDPTRPMAYGLSTGGHVVFINLETMTLEKFIPTFRKLTDLDIDPTGHYLYVVDNITGQATDQPEDSYILKFDLDTQTQVGDMHINAPLYQLALAGPDRFLGLQWAGSEPGQVYVIDATDGSVISSATWVRYWGGRDWANYPNHFNVMGDGSRAFIYDVGLAAPPLVAGDIINDTFTSAEATSIGVSGDPDWFTPNLLDNADRRLHCDARAFNPADITEEWAQYLEYIWAANNDGSLAFGGYYLYDAATGTPLEAIPTPDFVTGRLTLAQHDSLLCAFDVQLYSLHVIEVHSSIAPGDADADLDVDGDDGVLLFDALAGPNVVPAPTALNTGQAFAAFDADEDRDVDMHDVGVFQLRQTGRLTGYVNKAPTNPAYFIGGTLLPMADDIRMAGGGGTLQSYSIRVYGGGGGPFRVVARLHHGCPSIGDTIIPGTTTVWNNVPDDGQVQLLQGSPSAAVIPQDVWLEVTFSNDSAGWIFGGPAETGITLDTFALWDPGSNTWGCGYWFSGNPYAGFAATITLGSGDSLRVAHRAGWSSITPVETEYAPEPASATPESYAPEAGPTGDELYLPLPSHADGG